MSNNKQKRFIKNLTYIMDQLHLDNKQLAYILKCKTVTVTSWLIGKNIPSDKNQAKLALLVGMTQKSLFSPHVIFKVRFKFRG